MKPNTEAVLLWLVLGVQTGLSVATLYLVHRNQRSLLTMSAALDALTAQVHANTEVTGSVLTLIQGLVARIEAAGTDPVALAALTDELKTSQDALAAAVVANTPPTV